MNVFSKLHWAKGMCWKIKNGWLLWTKVNSLWFQRPQHNQLNVLAKVRVLLSFVLFACFNRSKFCVWWELENNTVAFLTICLMDWKPLWCNFFKPKRIICIYIHNNIIKVYLQKNSHKSKFWILWIDLIGWSIVLSYSLATSLNSYVSLPSWISCNTQSHIDKMTHDWVSGGDFWKKGHTRPRAFVSWFWQMIAELLKSFCKRELDSAFTAFSNKIIY